MPDTNINYARKTWNPVVGCTPELPCFERCWARQLAKRFAANPSIPATHRERYAKAFTVGPQLFPERLNEPLTWKKPQIVLVGSQTDLFHKDVPDVFLHEIISAMVEPPECEKHTFLILTKRPERLVEFFTGLFPNVWLGVSVENQSRMDRIKTLLTLPHTERTWVSFEPLLGPIKADLTGIGWVVCGCESGPRHRPMDIDWVMSLRDQCVAANVPFWFKQAYQYGDWGDDKLRLVHEPLLHCQSYQQRPF